MLHVIFFRKNKELVSTIEDSNINSVRTSKDSAGWLKEPEQNEQEMPAKVIFKLKKLVQPINSRIKADLFQCIYNLKTSLLNEDLDNKNENLLQ